METKKAGQLKIEAESAISASVGAAVEEFTKATGLLVDSVQINIIDVSVVGHPRETVVGDCTLILK